MSLLTRDFRNLVNNEPIYFDPGLNVLYGPNAQGKTNILEAISVNSTGTSLRGASDAHMVCIGHDSYAIRTLYQENKINREWTVEYYKGRSKINRLGSKKTSAHHPDRLKTAIFTPEDLYLIKGPPSLRRRFLDYILVQVYPEYRDHLQKYNEALKKRNLILSKGSANTEAIKTLEIILAECGATLTMIRLSWVKKLEQNLEKTFAEIAGAAKEVKLRYALSCSAPDTQVDIPTLAHQYRQNLENNREKEKRLQKTLTGPHREDLNIYLHNQLAKLYASQGEQRNLAIALKISELETYCSVSGTYPVLLLDEVLSDMDEERRKRLLAVLSNANYQVIMTTVELDDFLTQKSNCHLVLNGKVKKLD